MMNPIIVVLIQIIRETAIAPNMSLIMPELLTDLAWCIVASGLRLRGNLS